MERLQIMLSAKLASHTDTLTEISSPLDALQERAKTVAVDEIWVAANKFSREPLDLGLGVYLHIWHLNYWNK